jgi:hypothetical protein
LPLHIVFGTLAISTLLMDFNTVYETLPISTERPIKGYLQVVQIIVYIFGDIWLLAVPTNQHSPDSTLSVCRNGSQRSYRRSGKRGPAISAMGILAATYRLVAYPKAGRGS